MKICIISPIGGLEKYSQLSNTHLILSHVQNDKYVQFYSRMRRRGDTVILDNGAHEHGTADTFVKLEISIMTHMPTICVLPDTISDSQKTLSDSLRFLDRNADRFPQQQWMFVPQGENWLSSCLRALDDARVGSRISWIGVTRYLTINHRVDRAKAASLIRNDNRGRELKFHALGMNNGSVDELRYLKESHLFESLDTSSPVWRGWNGYALSDPEWPEIPVNFHEETTKESHHQIILNNLKEVL